MVVRRILLCVAVMYTGLSVSSTAAAVTPCCPIQSAYKVAGTWAVSQASTTDSAGRTFTLFYPTQLGSGGYRHPIITWGNGTGATPAQYSGILTQLASWGFVVVASTSGQTGLGTEILAGANQMVALNGTSTSVFYQKLDVGKIGAAGHSQGAGGAVNATINSNGLIKSTMVFNLPDAIWWTTPLPNWSLITTPIHFFTGSVDFLSTGGSQTTFYNAVSGPASKGSLRWAGHNVVQDANNAFYGYTTAWFRYTLAGDTIARTAFTGLNPPEIKANTAFSNQAQKNLP